VWERLHQIAPRRLNAAGAINWSRSAADASHVRFGGPHRLLAGRPCTHGLNASSLDRRWRSAAGVDLAVGVERSKGAGRGLHDAKSSIETQLVKLSRCRDNAFMRSDAVLSFALFA
jgi:hypothetical protein